MLNKMILQNVRFEERSILVNGDVMIGQKSRVDYGIIGNKIIAGEKVVIGGDLICEELRIDSFSTISGDVTSKADAYIGEFVSIDGKLTVFGDLEIGRNVRIKNGFEARGLITIQNPASIVFFLLLYLMLLFRMGKTEEVPKIEEEINPSLIVPEKCFIDATKISTTKDADIYDSRILGTLKARDIYISKSEVFGNLRGREVIVDSSTVHGYVKGKFVYLINSSVVGTYVKGSRVYIEKGCIVDGGIIAEEGVWIRDSIILKTDIGEESGVEQREVQKDVSNSILGNG
ncbi:MAG: acyltransferase [Archaeoglobaceae archaeon]|nr:acyltransferase [Archaeoglobaceae archaeon]MDW7989424.1 acyltransferase [Archaeoglobaceae archaeon]